MANQTTPGIDNDNRFSENIDTSKTLAATDSGVIQRVIADALTITLPASASILTGFTAKIVIGGVPATAGVPGTGANGTVGLVIATASGDGVTGGGWTAAINKGVTYTKATGRVGDSIVLTSTGANTSNAWTVQSINGAAWGRTA